MWCRCARARKSRPTTCEHSSVTLLKVPVFLSSARSGLYKPLSCCFSFSLGILPRSWCRYTVPVSMTVIQWVADFSERIKQLQMISQGAASGGAKELKVPLKSEHARRRSSCVPFAVLTVFVSRTSTCVWAACLCQRLTSLPPASMWPRLTAGLWRSCVWRSTSPLHRVPLWTPAASASKVRPGGSQLPQTQPANNT